MRPIWHWTEKRVEAHVLVALLGYSQWVCLKKKAERSAPSLTPWPILDQLGRIELVEVWFPRAGPSRVAGPAAHSLSSYRVPARGTEAARFTLTTF